MILAALSAGVVKPAPGAVGAVACIELQAHLFSGRPDGAVSLLLSRGPLAVVAGRCLDAAVPQDNCGQVGGVSSPGEALRRLA